jgi:glycosyltransferase involved in cell wall biosynthesis
MRILYDGYVYHLQKSGGINRYFAEVISRLDHEDRPMVFGHRPNRLQMPSHPHLRHFPLLPFMSLLKGPVNHLADCVDIIHPTYYHLTEPLTFARLKASVVITVHDFTFLRYADRYERSAKLIRAQEEAIRRADYLICVSHFTRNDLLEQFPQCESRSCVTHLASALVPGESPGARSWKKPYFLYVGSRVFYKNFSLVLEVMSCLKRRNDELDLLVAGGPWTEEETASIHRLGLASNVHLVTFPDDGILAGLYAHCIALFYLSEYEGFGLPALEAMTFGSPVIALRRSSMPEVVGPGGILLDPGECSPDSVAETARSLFENNALRSELSRLAVRQSAIFSWEQTARETRLAYGRATN